MWSILAFAKLGDGEKVHDPFAMLNPISHALDGAAADRYKVEPYVVAADVYSAAPHIGRGGWTWYTGSAAWMYRAGLEGILGIALECANLRVAPVIPPSWPGFEATLTVEGTVCHIGVGRHVAEDDGAPRHMLDGRWLDPVTECVRIPLDGRAHELTIILAKGEA